jgi:hypothetical protein
LLVYVRPVTVPFGTTDAAGEDIVAFATVRRREAVRFT